MSDDAAATRVPHIRVDLHCHTHCSTDCDVSYRNVISSCRRRGLDVLAITDHNRIDGAFGMAAVSPIPIIIGEEIMSREGEIIGLFIKELIPRGLSPEETVDEIHRQGGVVYVPHPFDRVRRSVLKRVALERIAGRIDVLEVFNARIHIPEDNAAAIRFAAERDILFGAGSDAHTAFEIGRAGVSCPPFDGAESFKRALRLGRIFGRSSTPLVHVASTIVKYRKRYLTRSASVRQ